MRIRLFLLSCKGVLGVFGVVGLACACSAAEQPPPKCALIDVGKSPFAALVEFRLLERDNTDWLERNQVDQLLAEQQLQALFAADATGARAAVGRILKADLLVVLRTDEREKPGEREKQKYAELVVAETAGGLRLIARQVPLSEDAETDVESLVSLVDQALAKHREQITAVYAVPPFVSQNLTYEHDHLKTAYARLLEQVFLEQPGVLVVEFAEAESLVREFQLAAPDQRLERGLPVYLLGEYRHEGRDDEQTVTVSLQVKSGDTVIETHKRTLAPEKVPAFLRQAAGQLLQSERPRATVIAPDVEARQLAQRADSFFKLGEWSEALSLMEASLLLDPDQPELRRSALRAASHLAGSYNGRQAEWYREVLRLERRMLEHFRKLALKHHGSYVVQSHEFNLFSSHLDVPAPRGYVRDSNDLDSLVTLHENYRQEKQALAERLIHHFAERGSWSLSAKFLNYCVARLSPKQRYAEKQKIIFRYQDRPGSVKEYTGTWLGSVEGRQFLHTLRTAPEANEEVRQHAEAVLAALDAGPPIRAIPESPPKKSTAAVSRLTFQPVELVYTDVRERERKLFSASGCLALDNDIDVLWIWGPSSSSVLTVRQPGRARLLLERSGPLDSLVYDGRYLWLTCSHTREGGPHWVRDVQVWVLDPVEEKAWQIGREHGLPLVSREEMRGQPANYAASVPLAHVAAVGPGEAIIAGWIGRSWLAHVVFDPQGEHQVKIFHEARELPATRFTEGGNERWKSTTAAFMPSYMLTFADPKAGRPANRRVLIGRGVAGLNSHPLVVNPSDLSLRVLEPGWSKTDTRDRRADLFEHAFYYTSVLPPKNDKLGLFRMGLPELQPVPVLSDVKEGHVLFDSRDGEIVNIIGREWWRGRPRDGRLESFGPVPWLYRPGFVISDAPADRSIEPGTTVLNMIGRSNHYGALVMCGTSNGPAGRGGPAQVIFDGPGMSMDEVLDYHYERSRAAVATPAKSEMPTLPVARPIPAPPEVLWKTRGYSEAAWSPDGKTIVTVGTAVRAWNAADGRLIADYPIGMSHVSFSPSGRYFATRTTTSDGSVVLWSTADLKPLYRLSHRYHISALAFSWDDQWLVTGCGYRTARIWNVTTGEEHLEMKHYKMGFNWAGFTPDNSCLLTFGGQMCAWNLSSGELVWEVESLRSITGVLPDQRILGMSKGVDSGLIAWDCTDHSSHPMWDHTLGDALAVSPDGRRLATVQYEGDDEDGSDRIVQLQVWDLATRRELLSQTFSFRPPSATFSPDGRVLLLRPYSGQVVRHELE